MGEGGRLAGRVERGEVRLFRFPAPDKERPVLVLTRDSAIAYLSRITVAPITSTIRNVPSEVTLGPEDGLRQPCAANLHNLVTVRQDALGRRLAQLSPRRMREVCSAIAFALGCDGAEGS
jgi:mRNA interferase MazF